MENLLVEKRNRNGRGITLAFTVILLSMTTFMSYGQQKLNHGFKLIEKRFVKEVNADCYYFEHVKSGAKLLKIANDDVNKTFGITFMTVPQSDNGVAHIIEHSVLNGSKNFPVKSPFDVLSKGSLKTFLNAFTSKDNTTYPYASMNDKDYFNLMHVYLDAVFNPFIHTDTRILKQEGWHYELKSKEEPVVYNGVVYNEMKGAFSSSSRDLSYYCFKYLFPNSPYGWESGGYPTAIPSLTQKEFSDFHKKYYHPENSYILLYGNADMNKEMEFIDREYLSKYTRTGTKITIPDQKPFTAMKDTTEYYPVLKDASTKDQTYLSLNLVAGSNTDYALGMALDIICDVLFNQESAPGRLALEKAGIGKDVSASVSNYKQNVIRIVVQNANPEDKAKFYEIVMNTLKEAVVKGINKEEVKGILNRTEFNLREGSDAQKGISYVSQIEAGWLFAGNPFLGLEYEKQLTTVKKAFTSNYLETLVQKYFINNKHALLLTLVPKPGLDNERTAKTEQKLKEYEEKLTDAEKNKLVEETKALIAFQKREDSPEALATIPMLSLKDINPKALWYDCQERKSNSFNVLYRNEFTNGIVYPTLYFDLTVLPQDMIPYTSLLSGLIGSMNTQNYTYGDLNRIMNIHTGGFYTSLANYVVNMDDNNLINKFVVSAKVMNNELPKLFELTKEQLYTTRFDDKDRLKSLLTRWLAQMESSIKRDGRSVASTRISSYFTNRGVFDEQTSGLEFYWFVKDLVDNFDSKYQSIVDNLNNAAKLLFTRENMMTTVTCGEKEYAAFTKALDNFGAEMPSAKPVYHQWTFKPEIKNEGILTASKVQYVMQGYDFKKIGYKWDAKMRVLNQIVSTDWLKNQVRVIGGAYGGYAQINPSGTITFNSYRDPNLKNTLAAYEKTPDYIANFNADEKTMTRFILGTISGMDMPLTVQQRGNQAFAYYFMKRTQNDMQKDREAILSTKVEDIRGFAQLLRDILAQKAICVYGNTDKINAEKDVFKSLISIDK